MTRPPIPLPALDTSSHRMASRNSDTPLPVPMATDFGRHLLAHWLRGQPEE